MIRRAALAALTGAVCAVLVAWWIAEHVTLSMGVGAGL